MKTKRILICSCRPGCDIAQVTTRTHTLTRVNCLPAGHFSKPSARQRWPRRLSRTTCLPSRPAGDFATPVSARAEWLGPDLTQIANCENVEIVAVCDVDLNRMGDAKKRFPDARYYQDWRELLDKEHKNIDSVNVSTPDHMHAPIAVSAMQLGKHVYGQKPLAHEIFEVRRMTEIAQHKKVVTQMGIQIHSDAYYRVAVRLVQEGAIGKVKEVHSWCNKSWGDPAARPDTHGSRSRRFRLESVAGRMSRNVRSSAGILSSCQLAQAARFRHRHTGRHGLPHFRSGV